MTRLLRERGSIVVGVSTAAGLHCWLRPQLRHWARSRIGNTLRPAQLAEASVVHAEVVPDLVDDGDPDLVGEVRFVT